MSTVIFKCGVNTWKPSNWEEGFPGIDSYEHVFCRHSQNTLIIIPLDYH